MNTSQKIEINKKFICSSCNRSFSGKKLPVDANGVFINQDDLRGYSCTGCQIVFCTKCADSQVMHTLRPSPCPQCQTSFYKADYIYEEKTGLFQAKALKKQVDADDGGGAEWYADSLITLFADEIRITSQWKDNRIGQSATVPLDKITGVELFAFHSEDDLGTLKFKPQTKGFLGRYFAFLPKVRYNREQEPRVRELADNITRALKFRITDFQTSKTSRMAEPFQASSNHGSPKKHSKNFVISEDDIALLEKLAMLHEKGILTDEEFAAKKAQILDL